PLFGFWSRYARQSPELRVRKLAAGQGLAEQGQCAEGARHPHVLAGRARGEPDAPRQPVRTRAEAVAPSAAGVELAIQIEQAGGGGVEVRRQLGDLVAESIQFLDRLGRGNDAGRAGFHERVPLLLGRIYTPLSEAPWGRHNARS